LEVKVKKDFIVMSKSEKVITKTQFREMMTDGLSIMVGGFLGVGSPHALIDLVIKEKTKNITLICNDTSFPDCGVGKWIVEKQVSKVITSHIGTNPESGNQLNNNETIFDLTPQGTLAEKIRAGGAGLGGILTPTGIGTIAAEGKKIIEIDGKDYILEEKLRADVALIKAAKADTKGNLVYEKAARNFNPIMAFAADLVIAEVDEIVEPGEIDPNNVVTPSILVDYVYKEEK
jgi:acetate CoA/acetoacetate CoA-transferase alpha subunit